MKALLRQGPEQVALGIAAKVRRLRKAKGWSQEEMARRAGIRFSTYRLFEKSGDVSLDRLLKMAEVLDRLDDFSNLFEDSAIPRLSGPAPDWKRSKKGISP